MRPFILRLFRRRIVVFALAATLLSCGTKERPQQQPLTADELYLIDAYVRVRNAGKLYPYQTTVADSLLEVLAGAVDTVRVARTIAGLNATPERWTLVLETIENRISGRDSTAVSEAAGD